MKLVNEFLYESHNTKSKDTDKSAKGLIKCGVKYLILRRGIDQKGEGNWDFSGGHIKENETAEQAFKRETFEETQVKLHDIKSLGLKNIKFDNNIETNSIHFFEAETDDMAVYLVPSKENKDPFYWHRHARPEHTEYKWVKYKDEMENLPMQEDMKKMLVSKLKDRPEVN